MKHISVTEPINAAFQRTGQVLFKPFRLGKWFVLGFCAFLAYLGQGGNLNFNFDISGLTGTPGGGGGSAPPPPPPGQWIIDNLTWLAPLAFGCLVAGVAIMTLLIWLRSRGKFMFIAALSRDHAAVVEPWKQYRELGNSLFRFELVLLLAAVGLGLLAIGAGAALAWPDLMAGVLTSAGVSAIVLLAVTLPVIWLGYFFIGMLLEDLVAPAMFTQEVRVREAWSRVRHDVVAGNVGTIVLFYLMRLLIGLITAVIATIVTCLTCCIAALPYIGTVILLPVFVFQRCYSLYFLQQFGSAWRMFVPDDDQPPTCSVCGYDLRGNPDATHCPECGSERTPSKPTTPTTPTPDDEDAQHEA